MKTLGGVSIFASIILFGVNAYEIEMKYKAGLITFEQYMFLMDQAVFDVMLSIMASAALLILGTGPAGLIIFFLLMLLSMWVCSLTYQE